MKAVGQTVRVLGGIRRPAARGGFTLLEMMIVIGLGMLMVGMALPSVIQMFNAGAGAQAYNLIAAQLTSARAVAIEKSTYAGVHVQLADARAGGSSLLRPKLEGVCYSAIVIYRPWDQVFQVDGEPIRIPGSYAFGKLSSDTVSGGNYSGDASDPEAFTTFTVVFSAQGSAVKSVEGRPVEFDEADPIFGDPVVSGSRDLTGSRRLWDYDNATGDFGVTAMTLIDWGEYYNPESNRGNIQYLNKNAQFLPLNVHTGQLFPRE